MTRPSMRVYPNPLLIRQTLADLILSFVMVAMYLPHNGHLFTVGKIVFAVLFAVSTWALLVFLGEWAWLSGSVVFFSFLVYLHQMKLEGSVITHSCLVPSTIFTGHSSNATLPCQTNLHFSFWRQYETT